jgi:hypothetical protein
MSKKVNRFFLFYMFLTFSVATNAQDINWGNLEVKHKHFINVKMGLEHGLMYGAGYGYQIKTRLPTVLNIEYSSPAGKNLTDDLKVKIGGKMRLYQTGNFHFSANIHGVTRRYKNDYVRLINFGSDFSLVTGYYKSKWFAAAEIGFDKAIVTHFKHSELFKTNFPDVKDGWYQPATGGNFYYGLQTGFSGKKYDIYLKTGKVGVQDFITLPSIPYYAQLGFTLKLSK